MRAHDLAGRRNQRRQTGCQANRRNQRHRFLQDVFRLELLELRHHVGVHTTRNLRILHQLIRFREVEVLLDLMTNGQQLLLLLRFRQSDRPVEGLVDLSRQLVFQRIESVRELLHGIECLQLLADSFQLFPDLRHSLHIDTAVDLHLLAEEIDQLDSGSCRTSGEIPDVRIDNIHPVHDGRQDRSQAITRCTMGMEINGYMQMLLEETDQAGHPFRRDQAAHILDGDHVRPKCLHLLRLVEEISIRKDRFR